MHLKFSSAKMASILSRGRWIKGNQIVPEAYSDVPCCALILSRIQGLYSLSGKTSYPHDAMIRKCFPHYWPFVRGIHWSLFESPHKGPVMWSCNVFIDTILNKLNKLWNCQWFQTPWWLYDVTVMCAMCNFICHFQFMMTSSNGNIFHITGHLCGEFTGPRWIPHTKASDMELWCFLWSAPE